MPSRFSLVHLLRRLIDLKELYLYALHNPFTIANLPPQTIINIHIRLHELNLEIASIQSQLRILAA